MNGTKPALLVVDDPHGEEQHSAIQRFLAQLATRTALPTAAEWTELQKTAQTLVTEEVIRVLEENQGSMQKKPPFTIWRSLYEQLPSLAHM